MATASEIEAAPTGPGRAWTDKDIDSAVPVRHPGRWIALAVLGVLGAQLVHGTVFNDRLNWSVVADYLFDPQILDGLRQTLLLTVAAMGVSLVLGTLLAIMRVSDNPVMSTFAAGYIWLFRSVPLIVQLLCWFFLAAVMPTIGIGIPFGPEFVTFSTTLLINQFFAAVLGLGLHDAAYTAEIVRGGVLSVPHGQVEAAEALGMRRSQVVRRVILPQSLRVIIPPMANSVINMLKTTPVVLVIALPDLLTAAQFIYSQNLQQIPLLIVATFWYVLLVSVLTVIQRKLERRYSRGTAGITRRTR